MSKEAEKFHAVSGARLRRERGHIDIRKALSQLEEEKSWVCESCELPLEDFETRHCRSCAAYWLDVSNGAFDDQMRDELQEKNDDYYDDAYEEYLADQKRDEKWPQRGTPWSIGEDYNDFL